MPPSLGLFLTLVLAAAAVEPAPEPEVTMNVRELRLDPKGTNPTYRIRTAIGYPAIAEFPEAFAGPPSCGDCALPNPASGELSRGGLFLLQTFNDLRYLAIKPRFHPGLQADGRTFIKKEEFVTSVYVRLVSGISLTLQVELSDRAGADARVIFTLPGHAEETALVRAQVAQARAALEREYTARVDRSVEQAFLSAFAQPHRCGDPGTRARARDVVVEVTELCRFGSRVLLVFRVQNRSRKRLELAAPELSRRAGGGSVPFEGARSRLSADALDFDEMASGVIEFSLGEGEAVASAWQLRVSERGGPRAVVASGFGF